MRKTATRLPILLCALLLASLLPFAASAQQVRLETSLGDITIELNAEQAPKTVENFLEYVRAGHYDGTVFHRVISSFMIQGGGFDADLVQKPTRPPIENEAGNGLSNERGTIAMARTANPNSATAQFFINTENNPRLDRGGMRPDDAGYTVFGRVVSGMETVDNIRVVETTIKNGMRDVPAETVLIKRATVVGD